MGESEDYLGATVSFFQIIKTFKINFPSLWHSNINVFNKLDIYPTRHNIAKSPTFSSYCLISSIMFLLK